MTLPWNSIELHGVYMEPYRIPQSSRGNAWGFHGITQNSIKVQGIPGNSVKFHGIPEFHGVILQGLM